MLKSGKHDDWWQIASLNVPWFPAHWKKADIPAWWRRGFWVRSKSVRPSDSEDETDKYLMIEHAFKDW